MQRHDGELWEAHIRSHALMEMAKGISNSLTELAHKKRASRMARPLSTHSFSSSLHHAQRPLPIARLHLHHVHPARPALRIDHHPRLSAQRLGVHPRANHAVHLHPRRTLLNICAFNGAGNCTCTPLPFRNPQRHDLAQYFAATMVTKLPP